MRLALTISGSVALIAVGALGFQPSAPLRICSTSAVSRTHISSLGMGYIPDGLSPEEWKDIKAKEKAKANNLGRVGLTRFKSRSFQAWQEAGAGHLFPVDPKKVKEGKIPLDKVPYMQRGGAWDDSDLAKKQNKSTKKVEVKKWSKLDKEYAQGGYVKEQSVSIFGGTPLPWITGKPVGVEWDNKRRLDVQKKQKRPGTNLPMTAAVKRRLEKEEAEERKKQARLQSQLKKEGKKGLFGLW